MFPIPDFLSRLPLSKEQEVCSNRGIRLENRVRQTHNCMHVTLSQKLFADSLFYTVTNQRTIRQNNRSTTTITQIADHQKQKQISTVCSSECSRIISFNTIRNAGTKRWICKNNINSVFCPYACVLTVQAVAVYNIWNFNIMQNQVSNAKHKRKRLKLLTTNRVFKSLQIINRMYILRPDIFNRTRQKSTGTTSRIQHLFSKPRINNFGHYFCNSTWSVKLTVITRTLQITQKTFINIAEHMTVFAGIKINFIKLVHNLADYCSVFHIVVGTRKNITN